MRAHTGRSWTGHAIEDGCPCPQEPCGLVDPQKAHPDCEHHPMARSKSIRQGHPADQCPSARQSTDRGGQPMTEICTRPGCEIQHDGRGYCPTCTAEIRQNLAEQRLAQGTADPCSCSPGACHGGHTVNMGMPVTVDEPEPIDAAKLRALAADANRATLQPGYPFGGEGPSQWRCNVDAMLGGPTGEFCGAVSPNLIIRLLNDLDSAHALTAQLADRVDELESADREHSQFIDYLNHAHGIDIDREDDDFREWQQQYAEVGDRG